MLGLASQVTKQTHQQMPHWYKSLRICCRGTWLTDACSEDSVQDGAWLAEHQAGDPWGQPPHLPVQACLPSLVCCVIISPTASQCEILLQQHLAKRSCLYIYSHVFRVNRAFVCCNRGSRCLCSAWPFRRWTSGQSGAAVAASWGNSRHHLHGPGS